jgi:hypothetical protein
MAEKTSTGWSVRRNTLLQACLEVDDDDKEEETAILQVTDVFSAPLMCPYRRADFNLQAQE